MAKHRHIIYLDDLQTQFIEKLCQFHSQNSSGIIRMLLAEAMRNPPEWVETEKGGE